MYKLLFILCVAFTVALPIAARADKCSATAQSNAYHSISKNKYVFAFDVNAGPCGQYACRGYVHFAIRYHFEGDSETVVDRTLVEYKVDSGNSRTHVSLEHYVATSSNNLVQIDDVAVEEVSCSSP